MKIKLIRQNHGTFRTKEENVPLICWEFASCIMDGLHQEQEVVLHVTKTKRPGSKMVELKKGDPNYIWTWSMAGVKTCGAFLSSPLVNNLLKKLLKTPETPDKVTVYIKFTKP